MEEYEFSPDKIVTEKKECLDESICEAETDTYEIFLKTGNWAMGHDQPVVANAIRLLESNSTKTDLIYSSSDDESIPEVNVTADMIVGATEHLQKLMVENFTKMVVTHSSNSLYTLEKCLKFFYHLKDVLDTNIPINTEKLKREIINLRLIFEKFESVKMELELLMKRVLDLASSNSVMKPGLKNKLLENMDRAYIINSTLYQSVETIMEKLEIIVDAITMKRSEELTRNSNSV